MITSARSTANHESLISASLVRSVQPSPTAWWKRRWLLPAIIAVLIVAISFMATSYVKAAGDIQKTGCINCPPPGAASITSPTGVAVDSVGNTYVVNGSQNIVQKFNSSGSLVLQIGSTNGYGSDNGQFDGPINVAVDGSDNVYVVDTGNRRIQKFDASGVYQSQFGSRGNGNGEFNQPSAIAIDGSGNIYVSDTSIQRVQKFNSSGTYQAQFGGYGSGDGQFSNVHGVATDGAGNVYVSDTGNDRIQKFNSSGVFQSKFGSSGYGNGQLYGAYGLAVDGANNIYVADSQNNRVQKFNSSGAYQAQWGSQYGAYGEADADMNYPTAVAVDSAGNIYDADYGNNRVQKFTNSGGFLKRFGVAGLTSYGGYDSSYANGKFSYPMGNAFDSSGNSYVVDTFNNRLQKFDSSGAYIRQWASSEVGPYGEPVSGNGNGEFNEPGGVAIDSADNIYVADTGNNRIQKFTNNGTYALAFGGSGPYGGGSNDGQLQNPSGVTTDLAGNVYVADSGNDRLQKLSSDGTFIAKSGSVSAMSSQGGGVDAGYAGANECCCRFGWRYLGDFHDHTL